MDWVSPAQWRWHDGQWLVGGDDGNGWARASVIHHRTQLQEDGWLPTELMVESLKGARRSTYFALELGQPAPNTHGWDQQHHISLLYGRELPPQAMRFAEAEGRVLIRKFIADHDLPRYSERPRLAQCIRTGAEVFAGVAGYRSHHLARPGSGSYNTFTRMRNGRLAYQPEPLTELTAEFNSVHTTSNGWHIGDLDKDCSVAELARALRHFVEYEVLPGPVLLDEYRPSLHITLYRPPRA